MPFRQLPSSNLSRALALDAIARASALVPSAEWPLSIPTVALAAEYRSKLHVETHEAAAAFQSQLREGSEKDAVGATLGLLISHFCEVFDFAIDRGVFRPSSRSFYHRDAANALVPLTNTDPLLLSWGHRIVDGEAARARAEGAAYVPMTMPSSAEVAAALAHFIKELGEANAARLSADREAADVAALNEPLDFFIRDVWNAIERFHHRESPAALRRKARVWGVTYALRPGEKPDPGETAGAPAVGTAG